MPFLALHVIHALINTVDVDLTSSPFTGTFYTSNPQRQHTAGTNPFCCFSSLVTCRDTAGEIVHTCERKAEIAKSG